MAIPCLFHRTLHCHFLCTWKKNKCGDFILGNLFPVLFYFLCIIQKGRFNTCESTCWIQLRYSQLFWTFPSCIQLIDLVRYTRPKNEAMDLFILVFLFLGICFESNAPCSFIIFFVLLVCLFFRLLYILTLLFSLMRNNIWQPSPN